MYCYCVLVRWALNQHLRVGGRLSNVNSAPRRFHLVRHSSGPSLVSRNVRQQALQKQGISEWFGLVAVRPYTTPTSLDIWEIIWLQKKSDKDSDICIWSNSRKIEGWCIIVLVYPDRMPPFLVRRPLFPLCCFVFFGWQKGSVELCGDPSNAYVHQKALSFVNRSSSSSSKRPLQKKKKFSQKAKLLRLERHLFSTSTLYFF